MMGATVEHAAYRRRRPRGSEAALLRHLAVKATALSFRSKLQVLSALLAQIEERPAAGLPRCPNIR
jgi:hypothetical protein